MVIKNFNVYFFMFILAIGTVAGFLLVKPYLSAIFLAALFAVIFFRPYEFIKSKIHSASIASSIMLFVVTVLIILPIIFVSGLIYSEVSNLVVESTKQDSSVQESVERIASTVANIPIVNVSFEQLESYTDGPELTHIIKNTANHFVSFLQSIYRGIVSSVITIFVMFFALFYFFIDGKKMVRKIMELSPLRDVHEKLLIDEFISMTRATLKGTVVIGLIQGIIGGISFAIAGVVSPVLWTVVMIVVAIIPAVGAGLIIFPAAIFMLILGNVWQAVFLAVVGIFVSTIDNVLRPKLVGKDTQMHSLVVFFATLGGLKVFGLIGFIVGPIVMALMFALWKIYAVEFKKELERFNA